MTGYNWERRLGLLFCSTVSTFSYLFLKYLLSWEEKIERERWLRYRVGKLSICPVNRYLQILIIWTKAKWRLPPRKG